MASEPGRLAALAALVLGLAAAAPAGAQSASPPVARPEAEVKAVFLHHLTRYLQWPGAPARFEVVVLGRSPVTESLRAIAARSRDRGLSVRESPDPAELGEPQVVFLARPADARLEAVLRATRGRPVLTVAEEDGLAARGVAVNFVVRDASIRLEINEAALRRAGITPGAQLLRVAIRVEDGG